jgi:hypothetical protein
MIPRFPLLLAAACLLACQETPAPAPAAGGAPMRIWSFEEPGLPAGWRVAETNSDGMPSRWESAPDAAAPEGGRVLRLAETLNSGATFNLLLSSDAFPADLDLSVRLRADSGKVDQGGGLLWRAQDADNYWITRWNPLEKNLRLYVVRGGERRTVADAKVDAPATGWHDLRVVAVGASVSVFFDGAQIFVAEDAELPGGGAIGLWTKADAATSFDALTLGIPSPPSGPIPGPAPL